MVLLAWRTIPTAGTSRADAQFDGQRALRDVEAQMALGPRIAGTGQAAAAADYIAEQLTAAGYEVEYQPFTYQGGQMRNVIGRARPGQERIILLGAHYDTRRLADKDPARPSDPVPGANDGASGVAVLLELARTLDVSRLGLEVRLAFFDAEDNGGIGGADWIVGSTHLAGRLSADEAARIEAMILVDMVGDADQQLYFEGNSDPDLSAGLWAVAAALGYDQHFIPQQRWTMLDDHIPFVRLGIPAVDIIDFDYPYHHTTADTTDKVSAESLERVGRTLEAYLESLSQ